MGTLPGAVLDPQVRDINGLDFLTSDGLGFLDPSHLGPIFSTVLLDQPDLTHLLYKLPKEIRCRIIKEIKKTHLDNLARVRSWQFNMEAKYKTCYQVSAKVFNSVAENLKVNGKFAGLRTTGSNASSA